MNIRRIRGGGPTCVVAILATTMTWGCDGGGDTSAGPAEGASAEATSGAPVAWKTGETADGSWQVAWRPVDGEVPTLEPFAVEVEIRGGEKTPSDDLAVLVDATMPHHGHGMNVEPKVTARASSEDGVARFLAEGMLLHMPGRWEFTVDVIRDDDVERAQWTITLDN